MTAVQRLPVRKAVKVLPWIALVAYVLEWKRRSPKKPRAVANSPESYEIMEPGRGRAASEVHHIPRGGWRDIAWRVYQEVGKDRLPIVAGGVTFFALLALFPFLGAFVSLYGLVADVIVVSEQVSRLRLVLPQGVVDILGSQMLRLAEAHEGTLSLAFAGSLLFAIWSANAGVNALFDGMNIAYGEAEKRNWFKRKMITLAVTMGGIGMITALTIILVAIPNRLRRYGLAPSEVWWIPFSWLAALALMAVFFAAIYRFGPSRQHARLSWVWPGAVAAAIGWLLGSIAFSTYVGLANYGEAYGPLGAVIAFMVWIWFTALVILLGAELNAEIEHQTACDTTTGPPKPLGKRGARMADTIGEPFNGFSFFRKKPPKKLWSTLRQTRP